MTSTNELPGLIGAARSTCDAPNLGETATSVALAAPVAQGPAHRKDPAAAKRTAMKRPAFSWRPVHPTRTGNEGNSHVSF